VNPAVTATLIAVEILLALVGALLTWTSIRLYRFGAIRRVYVAVTVTQAVLLLLPVAAVLAGIAVPPVGHLLIGLVTVGLGLPHLWRRRRQVRAGLSRPHNN
jgi:ABC-type Fe3+-siderophore transport system permease subunit